MARARWLIAAASGTRPRLDKIADCKSRQSTSSRDGSRSPITSMTAAHNRSAPGRSDASNAVQASQNCPVHHPSLPGSARPASSRSSSCWPTSRPRSTHHMLSAVTSRTAVSRSCSAAQPSRLGSVRAAARVDLPEPWGFNFAHARNPTTSRDATQDPGTLGHYLAGTGRQLRADFHGEILVLLEAGQLL